MSKTNSKMYSGSKNNKIKEIWKPFPIKEFKSKYEISNYGNVRNAKGNLLKHCIRSGYKSFGLCNNDLNKQYKIHRMVAKAFINNPDPKNKKCVNHINGDKLDNIVTNLEWCTVAENNKHAFDTGLNNTIAKGVFSYDPKTNNVETYESIYAASKQTGIDDGCICKVLSGERQSAGGLNWAYMDEDDNKKIVNLDLSQFKQIKDFPNYLINAKGEIYSLSYKRFMKFQNHMEGGKQVQLVNGNIQKTFLIHRLVGSYFLKKKDTKHNCILHIDSDKSNNNVTNLKWHFIKNIDDLESNYDTPFYNPKTAIKLPKKKSVKSEPKDLLTANPRNLSKKQREERKKLIEEQDNKKNKSKNQKIIEI